MFIAESIPDKSPDDRLAATSWELQTAPFPAKQALERLFIRGGRRMRGGGESGGKEDPWQELETWNSTADHNGAFHDAWRGL